MPGFFVGLPVIVTGPAFDGLSVPILTVTKSGQPFVAAIFPVNFSSPAMISYSLPSAPGSQAKKAMRRAPTPPDSFR